MIKEEFEGEEIGALRGLSDEIFFYRGLRLEAGPVIESFLLRLMRRG